MLGLEFQGIYIEKQSKNSTIKTKIHADKERAERKVGEGKKGRKEGRREGRKEGRTE